MTKLLAAIIALCSFVPTAQAAFSDVSESHPYYAAISWAEQANIIEGYEDGTFRPEASINRAEFAAVVVKAYQISLSFSDNPLYLTLYSDVSGLDWFWPYVIALTYVGLVNGYPDGTFRPSQSISFVEGAKIIANADNGSALSEHGKSWYDAYTEYLSEHDAIPGCMNYPEQTMSRGGMVEMLWRLRE